MEDALVLMSDLHYGHENIVLILVLMEDALVHVSYLSNLPHYLVSLNPCFNGRCTRTELKAIEEIYSVSLNPCFNGRCTRTNIQNSWIGIYLEVLILVLMEDALVQVQKKALFTKMNLS